MKKSAFILVLFLASFSMYGQKDITGTWNGLLETPNGNLRVDFHITATDDGFSSKMDSPDQNAFGIPVTSTKYENSELTIKLPDFGIEYKGKQTSDDLIEGKFTQMGQVFDFKLKKKKKE
jgi:hypothetical protein